MSVDFDLYRRLVKIAMGMHSDWREGQAYFNVLHQVRPGLAEKVRGDHAKLDPFYRDENIPDFLEWLKEHW